MKANFSTVHDMAVSVLPCCSSRYVDEATFSVVTVIKTKQIVNYLILH